MRLLPLFLLLLGCPDPATDDDDSSTTDDDDSAPTDDDDASDDDDAAADDDADCAGLSLPTLRTGDAAAAARGEALLLAGSLGQPLIPAVAIDNLWLAWGSTPLSGDVLKAAIAERYGLVPAPDGANDGWPLGLHPLPSGDFTVGCLFCHADVVAGQPLIGAGNSRVDMEGLFDDLLELAELAELADGLGIPVPEPPWDLDGLTGAAGAQDAYGLAMRLSEAFGPDLDINTEYGHQQPPAWWGSRHKVRTYSDGSGQATGHRTMAAMLFAFGVGPGTAEVLDADLLDVHAYLQTLRAPPWPFDPPDSEAVERGAAVFTDSCASCHGTHCDQPAPGFPDFIDDVGTDPARFEAFGSTEAAWVNGGWYGEDHPVEATDGYLATPLVGVWATAPYLHNGSIPDLLSLLDSSQRPAGWQRVGAEAVDYDPARVGWRFTTPAGGDPDTLEGRRVYDTSRPGLSNAGHLYGDALSESQRADLLAYLKTL